MGQVISFPKPQRHSQERLAAALNAFCAIVYVLGFFIAGPMLLMFGFGFAFTAQPLAALVCVGLLPAVWAATRAAYARL
ncbi:hypothetical protein [Candidatus Solirubrobacter pratensis]|uniref:hypothetical protein n=1 Tax=Candidatus Solirubrobacter pratensis TaxID=1298857 RepID=UPI0003F5FB99|nr:hypothetical protein [Candidatus Solirubrobacter pratensis]